MATSKIKSTSRKSKAAPGKTTDGLFFQANHGLSTLLNLFECVNHQAQIIINDGDPDTENYGLILEALAEKGIREADAAMGRITKAAQGAGHA